jgi:hypothetical protein
MNRVLFMQPPSCIATIERGARPHRARNEHGGRYAALVSNPNCWRVTGGDQPPVNRPNCALSALWSGANPNDGWRGRTTPYESPRQVAERAAGVRRSESSRENSEADEVSNLAELRRQTPSVKGRDKIGSRTRHRDANRRSARKRPLGLANRWRRRPPLRLRPPCHRFHRRPSPRCCPSLREHRASARTTNSPSTRR